MLPRATDCPHCGVVIRLTKDMQNSGLIYCDICQNEVDLSDKLSMPGKFVTVFVPQNESEHLAAQAILKAEDINFVSKNVTVQNLFGAGIIGTGFNILTGPIEIQVAEADAANAQLLLEEYFVDKRLYDIVEAEMDGPDRAYFAVQKLVNRLVNKTIIFSIFWLGGIGSSIAIYYGLKALRLIKESEMEIKGKWAAIFGIVLSSIEIIISPYFWITTFNKFFMVLVLVGSSAYMMAVPANATDNYLPKTTTTSIENTAGVSAKRFQKQRPIGQFLPAAPKTLQVELV